MKKHRPTLGALLTAFLGALVAWGLSVIPASVPEAVTASGGAVLLFGVGIAVGRVVEYVGKNAPWAATSHYEAVDAAAFKAGYEGAEKAHRPAVPGDVHR